MKTIEAIWISSGLTLTTATQLRFAGSIGLGEIMLVGWMLFAMIRLVSYPHRYSVQPATKGFFLFWAVAFAALGLGLLIAQSTGINADGFYHDAIAFVFTFIFLMTFSLSISGATQQNLQKVFIIFISATIVPLITMFFLPSLTPFVEPWYEGSRFLGWTINPNQLACVLVPLPFLSLYLSTQVTGRRLKIWCLFLMAGSLIVGIGTDSDAMMIGWLVGIGLLILLRIHRSILNFATQHRIVTFGYIANLFSTVFALLLLVSALDQSETGNFFTNLYDSLNNKGQQAGNQGDDRLNLWQNGLQAVRTSPVFGLGPGPHSGFTAPFLDVEAHNSFIDWASSAGIVGLVAYLVLLGWIVWHAWRHGSVILIAAMVAAIIFTLFHFVLRQTVFWFYLLSIAEWSTCTSRRLNPHDRLTEPIQTYLKEY
jgi:O-antigen ligase